MFSVDTYKSFANLYKRMQEYLVEDKVMIPVCRFPLGTVEISHARWTYPYKILREIGLNTYKLDIL